MSNSLTTQREQKAPVAFGESGVELRSLEEAWRFAEAVHRSGLSPSAYRSPEAVLIVMQTGMELGYSPMQAIRNMWPGPDGRPNEYVESAWARVLASGLVEEWSEEVSDTKATFRVLRKGSKVPIVSVFTIDQARRAGLIKTGGNYDKHPERMLKARAKGFAIKDVFPDVLRGMSIAEIRDEFFNGPERARDITPPKDQDPLLAQIGIDQDQGSTIDRNVSNAETPNASGEVEQQSDDWVGKDFNLPKT